MTFPQWPRIPNFRRTRQRKRPRRLSVEFLEDRMALSAASGSGENAILMANEVQALLQRAASASSRNDAIIAIVDREGSVLGVRVEAGISLTIQNSPALLTFAVDGALAEARASALFSTDQEPLTSRAIAFLSHSTITQREVESDPNITDPNSPLYGPGFVAPVSRGGPEPSGGDLEPTVDLFNIEATNRDSILHPGADGNKGPTDYIPLPSRFDVPQSYLPPGQDLPPPESYGLISGIDPTSQARGIGTLPGGVPIYMDGHLVGGIGVFFPGTTGYATEENSSLSATYNPALPDLSIVAEFMAFAALGGSSAAGKRIGTLGGIPPVPGIDLPSGQLNLNGTALPFLGPLGTQGTPRAADDTDLPVDLAGDHYLDGSQAPAGWLVTPHAGTGLTAADVVQIITQGIDQANEHLADNVRAANSTPRMVFAVSDLDGNILGLYRMPDAPTGSMDIAVAEARNTAYYADPAQLQPEDQVSRLSPGQDVSTSTFGYLALPYLPEQLPDAPPGPFSILNDPGTDSQNGLEIGAPLPASDFQSVQGYNAFHPGTNFRDPVAPANQNGVVFFPVTNFNGPEDPASQDGAVSFPGGEPLYKLINGVLTLVGGVGGSGSLPGSQLLPPPPIIIPAPSTTDLTGSAFHLNLLTSPASISSDEPVVILSGSSTTQTATDVQGAGTVGITSLDPLIPLAFSPDLNLSDILHVDPTNFAFGLETLLTGNQEQVAELLPQKESSLVPVVTLVPGTRRDSSTESKGAISSPSTLSASLVGFDPSAAMEHQPAVESHKPRQTRGGPVVPALPQQRQQPNESEQLLDLLIPKPTAHKDELPAGDKDWPKPLPSATSHSSSGARKRMESLQEASDRNEPSKLVQVSRAILTLAVIQTLWAGNCSSSPSRSSAALEKT
jgi:uncharacterized protein GlcG (DUF336 family)